MASAHVTRTYFMVFVADMDRAVRFYRDAFGGEVAFSSPDWSEVTVAGATVALHPRGAGGAADTGLGFEVDDLAWAIQAVTAAGGRVVREPRDQPTERIRLAQVADTEHNRITVAQSLDSPS